MWGSRPVAQGGGMKMPIFFKKTWTNLTKNSYKFPEQVVSPPLYPSVVSHTPEKLKNAMEIFKKKIKFFLTLYENFKNFFLQIPSFCYRR